MRKVLIKILIILNILAVLALLASYISVYIPPNRAWIPAFIGLAYPFFLGINVLFIIIWLILRIRYALLSFMAIAVGFGFFNRFIQWRGKSSDATDVKVMSYNVQYFRGDGNNLDRKQNVEHIVSFLAEQNADIICLQESRLRRNDIFNLAKTVQDLKNIKHYQFARSSNTFGSVTMTRYPIIDMGEIRFEHSRNITIYTDMQIGEDTVRVYNIHLQSYHIEPKDYAVLENVEIQEEKNRKVFRKVAIQMKDAFERRALQANEVRKHINDCKYEVIVCGDFNDTPTSYSYHTISGDLSDAFVDSGKGIGRTYAGQLPSFRIDYILHSKTIKSYNFETLDFKFSDHLPIVCDLAMND